MSNNNNNHKEANIDIAEKILANVTSSSSKAKSPEATSVANDTNNEQSKGHKIPAPFAKNYNVSNKALSPALNTAKNSLPNNPNTATPSKTATNAPQKEEATEKAVTSKALDKVAGKTETKPSPKAEDKVAANANASKVSTPAKSSKEDKANSQAKASKASPLTEEKKEDKKGANKANSTASNSSNTPANNQPKATLAANAKEAPKNAVTADPKTETKAVNKADTKANPKVDAKASSSPVKTEAKNLAKEATKTPAEATTETASSPAKKATPVTSPVKEVAKEVVKGTAKEAGTEATKATVKTENATNSSNKAPEAKNNPRNANQKAANANSKATAPTNNSHSSANKGSNPLNNKASTNNKANKEGLEKTKEFLNQLIKDKEDKLMKNKDSKEALSKAEPKSEVKTELKKEEVKGGALINKAPSSTFKTDGNGNGGNGGNNNNNRYSSNAPSPKPQTSKTVALLLAVALALGGFAVYKMYEPSLFSQEELDQAKPTYVTEKDFKEFLDTYNAKYSKLEADYEQLNQNFTNYKHNTNSTLELLQIRLNIITNENYKSAFTHQNSKEELTPSFEFSKATNYKNTAGYKLLVDKFVTYENLDRIMGSISFVIADKFRALEEGKALGPVQDELYAAYSDNHHIDSSELPTKDPQWEHQHLDSQGKVVATEGEQSSLAQHSVDSSLAPNSKAELSAEKMQTLVQEALQNPEVKTYIGTLIADYALEHNPKDSEELVAEVTKATLAKLDAILSPVNQKVDTVAQDLAQTKTRVATLNSQQQAQETNQQAELAKINSTLEKSDANLSELNKTVEDNKDRLATVEERLSTNENSLATVDSKTEETKALVEELDHLSESREEIFTDTLLKFDVVLATTFLEQAQKSIRDAQPLDSTLQKLKIAQELVTSSELHDAIATDITNLEQSAHDNGSLVKGLLSSSLANLGSLPDLDVTTPSPQSENLLENFKNAAGRFLSKFISVQKVENGYINSNANILIRENLRLSLENALASYQNNDKLSYTASLVRAEQILVKYYPKDNKAAQELLANVRQAKEVNFSIRDFKLTSLPLAIQDYITPTSESSPAPEEEKAPSLEKEEIPLLPANQDAESK